MEETKNQKWKIRLKKCIENFRRDIAIIDEYKKGVPTKNVLLKASNIIMKNESKKNVDEIDMILKMKLQAKVQRLKRTKEI